MYNKYNIFEKIFTKKISDGVNGDLVNNNQKLLKRIEELEYQQKKQILHLETLSTDIYDNKVIPKKICPLCKSELLAFLPFGVNPKVRGNALCPNCGSLERHRASYLFLTENTNIFEENIKMLHFAPEKVLFEIFSNKKNIEYLPVDLNPDQFYAKEKMDIQNIKYPEDTFDFIYCSHVLEHVPHDQKAMKELYRVLKPDGSALIMVPIKHSSKKTFEDSSVNTPELRSQYYGQFDHLRYYGLDFQEKLENAGFNVSKDFTQNISIESQKKYGLNLSDTIFYCTKNG